MTDDTTMPERVLAFIQLTGGIWGTMLFVDIFWTNIPKSELIWIGGFLQIVAFLLCFMVPNLLAFLWINRGTTARKIEKMLLDPDFEMEENE